MSTGNVSIPREHIIEWANHAVQAWSEGGGLAPQSLVEAADKISTGAMSGTYGGAWQWDAPNRNGAFTWGVEVSGLSEQAARALAAEHGGTVVRVPCVYPNGEVAR